MTLGELADYLKDLAEAEAECARVDEAYANGEIHFHPCVDAQNRVNALRSMEVK